MRQELTARVGGVVISKASSGSVPLFLAPMAGVTDLAFRLLARECGADVTVTEFTAAAGLSRADTRSWTKVSTDSRETPFIPQIFGGEIDDMVETVRLLSPAADVIDLNFGCPAPKVCRTNAGAALLGEPDRLVEIVARCIEASSCPVSVKLRLGTGRGVATAQAIVGRLECLGVLRVAVHGRTLSQRYSGVADWDSISRIVESVKIPIIANGDIIDSTSAAACLDTTNAQGLMIGRGAIGSPEIFFNIKHDLGWSKDEAPWVVELSQAQQNRNGKGRDEAEDGDMGTSEKGTTDIIEHAIIKRWAWRRYLQIVSETEYDGPNKNLKRHAISFTKGLPGSREMRIKLHSTYDDGTLATFVDSYLSKVIETNAIPAP
jgi:tRNA-dihydrouridine synthase B